MISGTLHTMLAKQLNYFLHFFFFLFCSVSNTMGGPHGNRMNTTGETTVSAQDDSDEQQEVIEVQILPQVCTQFFTVKRF